MVNEIDKEEEKVATLIGYKPHGFGHDSRDIEQLVLRKDDKGRHNYAGVLEHDWLKGTKVIVMNKEGELSILFEQ